MFLCSEKPGKFEVPTNHIFNHANTFYMSLAFRKCISYVACNSLHLKRLADNCVLVLNLCKNNLPMTKYWPNLRDLLAVPQRDCAYHLWGVRKFFSRKCGKLTKLMVFENNFFFRDTPEQKNNFFEISQNFWCQIWNFVFYWKIFKNQFRP